MPCGHIRMLSNGNSIVVAEAHWEEGGWMASADARNGAAANCGSVSRVHHTTEQRIWI